MIKYIGKKIFTALTLISPKLNTVILYIYRTKQFPHLLHPKNFNDKMTKLKVSYYDNELISKCTDKYEVREYIKNKGLKHILNEVYYIYDKVEEINFNLLPNQFALKCTHGCAFNIICKDKNNLNVNQCKKKIKHYLNSKYGLTTSELHYLNIKPRIICEKYIAGNDGKIPLDYKIYCFHGKAKCILVCSERETKLKLSYYNLDWKRLNYEKTSWSSKIEIEKPKKLGKMIEYAEILSKDFEFVRVDFYNDNGKIIFGELTFTPACCCAPYYSKKGNEELGNLL